MKKNIRISLSFASFPNSDVNSLAILVIVCLKNNLLFPALPLSIAELTARQTAFQNAITAAGQGGKIATATQAEARDALISALRQTAAYIQSVAANLTMSQVLSSGFDVVIPNSTQSPLSQPIFTLDNSSSTQLAVYLQAVTNAKAYQVQFSTGAGAWQEAGIYPNTKGILLTNLTPGTIYNVRIRAVGGSTQYSDWSATMSLMAT
ncbi:MAG TPA: fibronectin type III domain-containing protein [Verrucomicrobiae bacterium]